MPKNNASRPPPPGPETVLVSWASPHAPSTTADSWAAVVHDWVDTGLKTLDVWLVVEITDNPGPSVTNGSRQVIAAAAAEFEYVGMLSDGLWFEAYEERMRAHGGIDPAVCRVLPPGRRWTPALLPEHDLLKPLFRAFAGWRSRNPPRDLAALYVLGGP